MTVSAITSKIGKGDINYYDGVSSTFTRQTSAGGVLTCYKVGSLVDVLSVYGSNTDQSITSINSAISAAGSNQVGLEFSPGTWTISANLTIPANVTSVISPGAIFEIADGYTLTINGPFQAGPYRVFDDKNSDFDGVTFGGGAVDFVRPEWWAVNTTPGTTDMAAAFQCAINSFPRIKLLATSYDIDSRLYFNSADTQKTFKLSGCGADTVIYSNIDSTYLFTVNEDSTGTKVADWPKFPRCIISDMQITGVNATNPRLIRFNQCSIVLERLELRSFQYGAVADNYCDGVTFDQIVWGTQVTGGYFYYNIFGGDGLKINQVFSITADADMIYLQNCNGGTITANIGGTYIFKNCTNVKYSENHVEWLDASPANSQVKLYNSQILISNNYLRSDSASYYPIYINDDTAGNPSNICIRDNVFGQNGYGAIGFPDVYINELHDGSRVYGSGNIVRTHFIDTTDMSPRIEDNFGITIRTDTTNLNDLNTDITYNWNLLSNNFEIRYVGTQFRVLSPGGQFLIPFFAQSQPSIAVTESDDVTADELEVDEYFYAVMCYQRLTHTELSAEVPIDKASATKANKIVVTGDPGTVLYLYRGTTTGTYDVYYRIPLVSKVTVIYDLGTKASGYTVESSPPATSTDNTTFNGVRNVLTGQTTAYKAAAPTTGTWAVGDIVWDTNAASGNPPGWYCTVAGTPGTWTAMADLA